MLDFQLVRDHLKADGDDDHLIGQYLVSAMRICEGFCNRKFYASREELTADFLPAIADLEAARTARDTALADTTDCDHRELVEDVYQRARADAIGRCNGVVVDGAIQAAILMVAGHLYKNRQEVVVGQYSGASQMPLGAKRILEPYLWIASA